MRVAHFLLILLTCAIPAFSQAPQPVPTAEMVADVYLARDDGAGKAGEVTETFSPADIPIHCIVKLTGSEPASVKMNLVAVKVNGVRPESSVVTASYTTRQGQNQVYFTGRPDGKWTAGTYRIDIFVGGKKEKSVEFAVKGTMPPTAASNFIEPKPKPKARSRKKKQ